MRAPLLASLALVAALAGCQIAVEVRVTGTPEAPVFEFERDGGGAVSIMGLSVGTEGRPGTVWSISSDRCIDISYVIYGQAPPGFRQEAPAPRLEARRNYDVDLIGCGASGGARFAILGDQIVAGSR